MLCATTILGDCWLSNLNINGSGYSTVMVRAGGANTGRPHQAHRVVYEALVGPIGDGDDLHHTCIHRTCVNPLHLRPISHADHTRAHNPARPECKRGHAFDESNTYWTPTGRRQCRACNRARQRGELKHL